ncbi:N(2)-fixation sustaining protein CowN [Azospirillum doebereinerae]
MTANTVTETSAADRYVSFNGIDFEGNMQTVLQHLFRYIDDPATGNAFWDRFKERLAKASDDSVRVQDKLLLLHSHVYYMVELFEEHEDEAALRDLKKLEEECF